MSSRTNTIVGRGKAAQWDEQTFIGRLQLILEYDSLFLAMGLVTERELFIVRQMSPTEWEYILIREEQPIFSKIDLHEAVKNQITAEKLETALKAVFFDA